MDIPTTPNSTATATAPPPGPTDNFRFVRNCSVFLNTLSTAILCNRDDNAPQGHTGVETKRKNPRRSKRGIAHAICNMSTLNTKTCPLKIPDCHMLTMIFSPQKVSTFTEPVGPNGGRGFAGGVSGGDVCFSTTVFWKCGVGPYFELGPRQQVLAFWILPPFRRSQHFNRVTQLL